MIDKLLKSRILISFAAASITISSKILFGLDPRIDHTVLVVFFGTYIYYNIHSLFFQLCNIKERFNSYFKFRIISLMGFLGCLFLANTNELILLFFIVLIASLYSFPYLGNIIFIFNLRALPYIKLILVVLIWTMSTVLLPYISYNPTLNNGTLLCITIERFGFLFAIIVPFDIRDIVDDRKLAIKTIPLLLGEKKSILLANVSLILYLISVFGYYFYSGQMLYLVSGIISFLVTFYIINAKSITKNRIYYELFLDGMILFQGMLIFISYQLKF